MGYLRLRDPGVNDVSDATFKIGISIFSKSHTRHKVGNGLLNLPPNLHEKTWLVYLPKFDSGSSIIDDCLFQNEPVPSEALVNRLLEI